MSPSEAPRALCGLCVAPASSTGRAWARREGRSPSLGLRGPRLVAAPAAASSPCERELAARVSACCGELPRAVRGAAGSPRAVYQSSRAPQGGSPACGDPTACPALSRAVPGHCTPQTGQVPSPRALLVSQAHQRPASQEHCLSEAEAQPGRSRPRLGPFLPPPLARAASSPLARASGLLRARRAARGAVGGGRGAIDWPPARSLFCSCRGKGKKRASEYQNSLLVFSFVS